MSLARSAVAAHQLAQPHALQSATLLETCVNTWLIDVVAVGSQEDIGSLVQHVRACADLLQGYPAPHGVDGLWRG